MTISKRSIRLLMEESASDIPISDKAADVLRDYLMSIGKNLTFHAIRIHEKENLERKSWGEEEIVRLAPRHIKMAIEGKYPELVNQNDKQES